MKKDLLALFFLCMGVLGCTVDFDLGGDGKSLVYNPLFNSKVDILFIVDNSGSMEQHQEYLANTSPELMARLLTLGVDFQMAVTTTDLSANGHGGRFVGEPKILMPGQRDLDKILRQHLLMGSQGSSQEEGLEAARRALSEPLISSENAGFLRDDAFLAVLVLSNENDYSADKTQNYIDFFNELKPPLAGRERGWMLNFIGVTGKPEENCRTFSDYKDVGHRYLELVQVSHGQSHTICTTNLKTAIDNLQNALLTLLTEISLERKPDPETIVVMFNGTKIPQSADNGWTYSAEKNSVAFHGKYIPKTITKIDIYYVPTSPK